MIILTRLGGHALAVNPDLIERAEATPDTVITLIDGHKLVVTESLDDVIRAVRTWRAGITAEAYVAATQAALLAGPPTVDEDFEETVSHRNGTDHHRTDGRTPRVEGLALATALASHPMARVLPISRKDG
jgi:flagellar protein FlbD